MNDKLKREPDDKALARGRRIEAARKERGLSQAAVAEAIGLKSRERVSQIEAGYAGELQHTQRLTLCKLLGIEERELMLDPESAPRDFDMPLSPEAKSIAYRWDDLPEPLRGHIKGLIAVAERTMREAPDLARAIYPEITDPEQPTRKKA